MDLNSHEKDFMFTVTGYERLLYLDAGTARNPASRWPYGIVLDSFDSEEEAVSQARGWLKTKGNTVNEPEDGRGVGSVINWTVRVERMAYDDGRRGWYACDRRGLTEGEEGFNWRQTVVFYETTLDGSTEKRAFEKAVSSYLDCINNENDGYDTVSECMTLMKEAKKGRSGMTTMEENAVGAAEPVDPGYTLIAYDEESRAAIVFRGLGGFEPYVACYGYDAADGTWSQGRYCSELSDAVGEYDRMRGVEEPFCEVRWYREDVAQFIEERLGLPATESNIDSCIEQLTNRHGMQDMSITAGWESMDAIVYGSLLPDRAQEERKAGSIRI